jgi:hypothetical protein
MNITLTDVEVIYLHYLLGTTVGTTVYGSMYSTLESVIETQLGFDPHNFSELNNQTLMVDVSKLNAYFNAVNQQVFGGSLSPIAETEQE